MTRVYSAYEAKAKFSEVLRQVQAGQKVIIAYRGKEIAEIRPIVAARSTLEQHLKRLEERGVIVRAQRPVGPLRPLAKRPGALARFLESRD